MQPRYEQDHLCPHIIGHNARVHGGQTAVVCDGERLTWAALEARTSQFANALAALGLGKGDKVCMFMPNSVAAFVVFWGAIRAGCVIVPLNVMLDGAALARLTNASDGRILFADRETRARIDAVRPELTYIPADRFFLFGADDPHWRSAEALIDAAPCDPPRVAITPDDSMTIIYTSGTTGTPKGIEHAHFGRLNYPYGFGAGLGVDRYAVAICATPIYASGTWITMLPVMYNGGKVVLLRRFSAEAFFEAVAREGGTHSFMVPAQYITLLQHDAAGCDVSSLRVLVSAGQSLPEATRARIAARFPQAGLYEVYGMTEGFFTIANPGDFARGKAGTVGKPGFLEDIRIIDDAGVELPAGAVGEIVAYGPGMMKGYYGRPDLTAQTVWVSPAGRTYLRSGDLGRLDEEGFLFVSGRKKDMIKSGGINIYAVDLEEVLMTHPDVLEVAVIGVPDPKWSETPVAIVIARPGVALEPEALRIWANARLAAYQRLAAVHLRTDMPRATYGKIQKDRLRAEYGAGLPSDGAPAQAAHPAS